MEALGTVDLSFSNEGDFVLTPSGDLALSHAEDFVREEASVRVKTSKMDWLVFPGIGSNIDQLIGKRSSRETAELGAYLIRKSLTYDNFLSESQFKINYAPFKNSIVYHLSIFNDALTYPLIFNLDLNFGIGGI